MNVSQKVFFLYSLLTLTLIEEGGRRMVLHAYLFQMIPDAASVFSVFDFHGCRRDSVACISLKLSFLSFYSQSVEFKAYLATSIAPELQVHASGISSGVAARVNTIHYYYSVNSKTISVCWHSTILGPSKQGRSSPPLHRLYNKHIKSEKSVWNPIFISYA